MTAPVLRGHVRLRARKALAGTGGGLDSARFYFWLSTIPIEADGSPVTIAT